MIRPIFLILIFLYTNSCKREDVKGTPEIKDDATLFVCGDQGTCSAISAKTGKVKWQTKVSAPNILSSPTSENGLVFISSSEFGTKGKLIALDIETGKEVRSFSTPGIIFSTPLISEGKIYFGSWLPVTFSEFHSVDAKSGKLMWTSRISSYFRDSSPTIYDNKVIFSTRDGLEMLNKENGMTQTNPTTASTNLKLKTSEVSAGFGPLEFSSPCVSGNYAYLVASNGFAIPTEPIFEIYNLITNKADWKFTLPASISVSSPTVYNDLVFFNDHNYIYAVGTKSHDTKWKFKFPNLENHEDYPYGSPTVQDGVVYIISLGSLFAIDAATGTEKWRYSNYLSSSPIYYGSIIYVNSKTDTHAINAENGQLLWKHPLESNESGITSSPIIINNKKEVFHSGINGNHQ